MPTPKANQNAAFNSKERSAADRSRTLSLTAGKHSWNHDLKQLLVDIEKQVAASAIRHDELLAQLIGMHKELREEISCMRCSSKEDAGARKGALSYPKEPRTQKSFFEPHIDNCARAAETDANPWSGNTSQESMFHEISPDDEQLPSQDNGLQQVKSASTVQELIDEAELRRSKQSLKLRSSILNNRSHHHMDAEIVTLKQRADHFLKSKEFEMLISAALMCNALVMCFESQYYGLEVGYKLEYQDRVNPASVTWVGAEEVFSVLGWIFGIIFLLEFLLKLICWRHRYFCNKWNWLDFVCIIVFMLDKFAAELLGFNPHMLRLVRLVRLGRLVRIIRYLESLEALYVMTTAIFGLSRILGWAIFLLTVLLMTCDLFVVQLLHSTYFAEVAASDVTEDHLKKYQLMYSYFGTVSRCLLSMFEITLGNWPVVARLLSEEVSQWFIILCVGHKLTIGFAVIGVVTGVILQETFKVAHTDDVIMMRAKRRQSAILKAKMQSLFNALDEDNDGKLTLAEFEVLGSDMDVKTWLSSLDIEVDDLPQLFKLCDEDVNGVLSLDEIVHRIPRIRGTARSIDLLTMIDDLKEAILSVDGHDRSYKPTYPYKPTSERSQTNV